MEPAIQGRVIQMLFWRRYRCGKARLGLNMIQAEAEHRGNEKDEPQKHDHVHF